MLVDARRIPCDYVILAARKRGAKVTRINRPLPPRPEAAKDMQPDPLWQNVGRASARPSRGRGPKPALRLTRLAILAQQPRRANLYRESKIAAFLEHFRSRTFDDPQIQCLLHTAATLAAREAR
jgi:hypothetical protein